MQRSFANHTMVEFMCPACGYSYKLTIGYMSYHLPNVGKMVNKDKNCPICRKQMDLSAVLCELDANHFFDIKKKEIELCEKTASIDWVCKNCGVVIYLELKGYNKLTLLKKYIYEKREALQEKGCSCGNPNIAHSNLKVVSI